MANKTITEKAMDIISKYPELEKQVKVYLETATEEKKANLGIDALKVMAAHADVKPLEGLFKASAGPDNVPDEVMAVLRKYPEFEEKVNTYLKKAMGEKKANLGIDALKTLEGHADVEAVKLENVDENVAGLVDLISKYPEAEKELKDYVLFAEKQGELNLSADALKVLEK